MELGLMLGTAPVPEKGGRGSAVLLAMRLGVGCGDEEDGEGGGHEEEEPPPSPSQSPSLQLNLLTLSQPRQPSPSRVWLPWATENRNFFDTSMRGFDVNRAPPLESAEEGTSPSSSPNSTISSFRIDFSAQRCGGESRQRGGGASGAAADMESSRLDDEDENGLARKKLRLSKDQSAFLEESFKQHNTINPKQKLALAKQLNLRPRQVEVWFQNRRARTKLKQTEVQCEYLKRCCQTLTEENRRLKKEVAELRALKTCSPFSANFPAATTLSMCASCERVASNSTDADHRLNNSTALFSRLLPFASGPKATSAAPRQASQPTDSRNHRAPALAGH